MIPRAPSRNPGSVVRGGSWAAGGWPRRRPGAPASAGVLCAPFDGAEPSVAQEVVGEADGLDPLVPVALDANAVNPTIQRLDDLRSKIRGADPASGAASASI